MTHRIRILAVALALAAGTGCASDPDATPKYRRVLGYDAQVGMMTAPAPETGHYSLFIREGNGNRIVGRTYLKAGEVLGFKGAASDADGKPVKAPAVAVAGPFVVPIDPAREYQWRRVPSGVTSGLFAAQWPWDEGKENEYDRRAATRPSMTSPNTDTREMTSPARPTASTPEPEMATPTPPTPPAEPMTPAAPTPPAEPPMPPTPPTPPTPPAAPSGESITPVPSTQP